MVAERALVRRSSRPGRAPAAAGDRLARWPRRGQPAFAHAGWREQRYSRDVTRLLLEEYGGAKPSGSEPTRGPDRSPHQMAGGSASRSNARCFSRSVTNSATTESALRARRIHDSRGVLRRHACRVEQRDGGSQGEDRLGVPELLLDELESMAVARERLHRCFAVGSASASYSTAGIASKVTSTFTSGPATASMRPRREPTNRGTAPAAESVACSGGRRPPVNAVGHEDGNATGPYSAISRPESSERAFETSTSGAGGRFKTGGSGSGTSMPRPRATPAASSLSTLASIATTRRRTALVCTRVSSKR